MVLWSQRVSRILDLVEDADVDLARRNHQEASIMRLMYIKAGFQWYVSREGVEAEGFQSLR